MVVGVGWRAPAAAVGVGLLLLWGSPPTLLLLVLLLVLRDTLWLGIPSSAAADMT
jgi:hypothetical protein